jgi:hypothetical protein
MIQLGRRSTPRLDEVFLTRARTTGPGTARAGARAGRGDGPTGGPRGTGRLVRPAPGGAHPDRGRRARPCRHLGREQGSQEVPSRVRPRARGSRRGEGSRVGGGVAGRARGRAALVGALCGDGLAAPGRRSGGPGAARRRVGHLHQDRLLPCRWPQLRESQASDLGRRAGPGQGGHSELPANGHDLLVGAGRDH